MLIIVAGRALKTGLRCAHLNVAAPASEQDKQRIPHDGVQCGFRS